MKKWSEEHSYSEDMLMPSFPDGGAIDIQFKCPKCGELIEVEGVEIPSPSMVDDNGTAYGDSEPVECPNCHKEYGVSICNSFTHWSVLFDDGNEEPDKLRFANIKYNYEDQDVEGAEE